MFNIKAGLIDSNQVDQAIIYQQYHAPEIGRNAQPGQFVHIRVRDSVSPLLRRPFSIFEVNSNGFSILFDIKGTGTRLLAARNCGESVDIIGPLGNGFNIKSAKRHLLIAGGLGLAPLYFLAQYLRNKGAKAAFVYGSRDQGRLAFASEIVNSYPDSLLATEDGSVGQKGKATEFISEKMEKDTAIYACGPIEMLITLARLLHPAGISFQLSLEGQLGCGLGTCLGCVVKTTQGYQRICREGPVFDSRLLYNKAGKKV